jgi:homoserine trans-succinylase
MPIKVKDGLPAIKVLENEKIFVINNPERIILI